MLLGVAFIYSYLDPPSSIPEEMSDGGKRTVQVNVRMSEEDYELLKQAADKLWPEAIISNSGILLGLAKLAAKDILGSKPKDHTSANTSSPAG